MEAIVYELIGLCMTQTIEWIDIERKRGGRGRDGEKKQAFNERYPPSNSLQLHEVK